MHELGITQGIVDRARETAVEHDAGRITDVYVRMTPAADFTESSVAMYFELLTQDDDFFRGAALHVEHAPLPAACLDCGQEFTAAVPGAVCAHCGSENIAFAAEAPMIQLTDVAVED